MGCCVSNGSAPRKATAYQTFANGKVKELYKEIAGDTPVVVIKLIAGYNLPVTDKVLQNSDPFFVFEVKPDTSVGGTQKQRSTHKPRTLNPRWDPPQRFQFITADQESCKILIQAWDYQLNGKHNEMGQSVINAKDVTVEPVIIRKKICDVNSGAAVGEVELELSLISADRARTMDIYAAYEFQRFAPIVGWGHDSPGHLLPTDPGRWCSGDGKKWSLKFDDVVPQMPDGYIETAPWSVYVGEETDTEGWEYAVDFSSHNWFSAKTKSAFARRRLWTREVIGKEEPSGLAIQPEEEVSEAAPTAVNA